jgi:hypothetical protein
MKIYSTSRAFSGWLLRTGALTLCLQLAPLVLPSKQQKTPPRRTIDVGGPGREKCDANLFTAVCLGFRFFGTARKSLGLGMLGQVGRKCSRPLDWNCIRYKNTPRPCPARVGPRVFVTGGREGRSGCRESLDTGWGVPLQRNGREHQSHELIPVNEGTVSLRVI